MHKLLCKKRRLYILITQVERSLDITLASHSLY